MLGLLLIAFLALSMVPPAFAQGMRSPTSSNSLDILVEPLSDPIIDTETTEFKVTFLQPGTDIIQPHIDYDFVIEKDGTQVFSAAAQTGQPYLHTAEPTVYIPYKFEEQGEYTIRVTVSAIYFFPLEPETATFQVMVTPEFPFVLLVMPIALGSAMTLARLLRFRFV